MRDTEGAAKQKPHATFCRNRGWATAPGDPVVLEKYRRKRQLADTLLYSCTVLREAGGAIPPAYSPQPAVAADPGQGALNDPPNTLRNQGSAVTAGAGLDGDAEHFASLGQPLAAIAEITQSCSFKAVAGKMRDRQRNGGQAAIAISEPGLALKNCPKPEPSLPLRTRPIWLWLPDPIPLMVPP